MSLISLVVSLLVIAVIVILVRMFLPETAQPVKNLIIWVLFAIAIWLVLVAFGVLDALSGMRTPHIGK